MSKDDGNRFEGDDKIIDITNYVKNDNEEDIEIDEFASRFIDLFNQNIITKQKEEVRKRFIDFMINFLLCTQVAIVFAICFIIIKIY